MAVRSAAIIDAEPRKTARVKRVAVEYFDADETQVRRLIAAGELETHTIGKRGVRVYLDSVAAYQQRKTKPAKVQKRTQDREHEPQRPKLSRATRALHDAAMAVARQRGYLP